MVALRHKGRCCALEVPTLPEMLRDAGYNTTCVGQATRPRFDTYLTFPAGEAGTKRRSPKAQNSTTCHPRAGPAGLQRKPFFLFLRHMDPYRPIPPPAPTSAPLPRQRV
ncbi:MAG: hypothetical protein R2911_10095 [Caldilineaceae bacterium]